MTDQLSPPGSSQYDSNTLYVGDGTWDSTRNTFLLPNIQGLNLATTRYNGMGNRFRALTEYHTIIKAHAAIACIIFLFLIPTAITTVRFYQKNRRLAKRVHIWINILVVFLITVVLILGWFAVGPERSLTNPHHGIGVALYTLVLVQVIGGAIVRHMEKWKDRDYIPVKIMLHHWMGRAIALLGLAQLPIGFALYGSPKGLFIMYALIVAAWIILYFVLSHRYQSERWRESEYGSYVSSRGPPGSNVQIRQEKTAGHMLRDTALVGGALAGIAALRSRMRSKSNQNETVVDESVVDAPASGPATGPYSRHSRRHSGSLIEEEEHDGRPKPNHTWRDRILEVGAGVAAFEGIKRLFGKRRENDEEENVAGYSRPPMGDNSSVSRVDVSRVEAGQAPYSPADPRRRRRTDTSTHESSMGSPSRVSTAPPGGYVAEVESPLSSPSRPARTPGRTRLRRRRADSIDSVSSVESVGRPVEDRPRSGLTKGEGFAAALAGITGLAFLREKQKQRRERKEQRRAEELRRYDEEIDERIHRTQQNRPGFGDSVVDDGIVEPAAASHSGILRHDRVNTGIPPLPSSAAAPHSVSDEAFSSVDRRRRQPGYPVDDSSVPIPTGPGPASGARFSEANTSRVRFQDEVLPAAAAAGVGALAGGAIAEEKARRREDSRRRNEEARFRDDIPPGNARRTAESSSTSEAPVHSLGVQIHPDNRHVTLRRLNDEEAAAEREARRRERRARRRPRASSASSAFDSDTADAARYRRRPNRPPTTAEMAPPMQNIPMPAGPARGSDVYQQRPPPAPAVPMHSSPYASPPPAGLHPSAAGGYDTATGTGTGTELSAFDENRRRRRAERAAAKARAIEGDGPPPAPLGAVRSSGPLRGEYT